MSGRAESLLALAWCAGLIDGLDFSVECPKTLVNLFPSVPKGEHASTFGSDLAMREKRLIVAQCDLAYCLHWSIRDAQLNGRVLLGKLHPVYVVERRRALEWMLSTQDWDDVSLDT